MTIDVDSEECGEFAEAVLSAVQRVARRHDSETKGLSPLLFALASVQALFINGLESEEERALMVAQAMGMLAYTVKAQRVDGLIAEIFGDRERVS